MSPTGGCGGGRTSAGLPLSRLHDLCRCELQHKPTAGFSWWRPGRSRQARSSPATPRRAKKCRSHRPAARLSRWRIDDFGATREGDSQHDDDDDDVETHEQIGLLPLRSFLLFPFFVCFGRAGSSGGQKLLPSQESCACTRNNASRATNSNKTTTAASLNCTHQFNRHCVSSPVVWLVVCECVIEPREKERARSYTKLNLECCAGALAASGRAGALASASLRPTPRDKTPPPPPPPSQSD